MDSRIQQEVDKTLEYLEEGLDISVNPMFAQGLTQRMSRIKMAPAPNYRSRISYPVVIVLLMVLNVGAGLVSVKARQSVSEETDDSVSVLATEYGLRQNDLASF